MELEFSAEFRTVLNNLKEKLQQPGDERARLIRKHVSVDEVDAALCRIENGKYGICASCFLVIPRRDLLDEPQRLICSRCATRRSKSARPALRAA
jgi:RNA polymerase-binding transcription factor DksA